VQVVPEAHAVAADSGFRRKLTQGWNSPVAVHVPLPAKQTGLPQTPLPVDGSEEQTRPAAALQGTAVPHIAPSPSHVWTPEPSGAQRVDPGVQTSLHDGANFPLLPQEPPPFGSHVSGEGHSWAVHVQPFTVSEHVLM
jgi:hypothetical protein